MAFKLWSHIAHIVEDLLIDDSAYLVNHLELVSLLVFLIIFVSYCNRECSSTDFKGFSSEVCLEEMNIHRSRGNNHFEIFSFCQKLFHKAQYHVNADSSFVGLVND